MVTINYVYYWKSAPAFFTVSWQEFYIEGLVQSISANSKCISQFKELRVFGDKQRLWLTGRACVLGAGVSPGILLLVVLF